MRTDYATDKYALIITSVICLSYMLRRMCLGEIVYIGIIIWKLEQVVWMLLGNSFNIREGKSQSTLFILSFKLILRCSRN